MQAWQIPAQDIFKQLSTSESGLSHSEAKARLERYGSNEMPYARRACLRILLEQFKNPLLLLLVGASIISLFVSSFLDTAVIIGIIFIDGFLGFWQEWKSEKAVRELKRFITYKAKVIRDGERTEIAASQLVPGDMVKIEIGDKVPADIRLLSVNNLSIDESLLTGESFEIRKSTKPIKLEKLIPQKLKNTAFKGTIVTEGEGTGIVFATGSQTELGKITTLMKAVEEEGEFQKNMRLFGNNIIKGVLVCVAAIFLINALLAKDILLSFMFALALAVGIVPEALPIVVTVALSIGALHLARKDVVTKKLASIEDLGNIDVLCTDKTGTLTENKITLEEYFDANGKKNKDLLLFSLLCNSAIVHKESIKGNPIDAAIWRWAKKNFDLNILKEYEKIQDITFDYNRRRMSVVVKGKKMLFISKGAPESIIKVCKAISRGNKTLPIERYKEQIEQRWKSFALKGYRIVAVALKEIKSKSHYSEKDESNLTLLGFLAFLDPPKITAIEAIEMSKRLGIRIKIITGDDPLVTREIARKLNLPSEKILTGNDIERMGDEQLKEEIENTNIFARVTPEQKQRIITTLKANGHTTAFLGDGVNDALALKAADVGISVDSAVDVAKDSADIVLLKKDLNVLFNGVREGRKIFSNVVKYVINTMSANIGNMGTLGIISPFTNFIPLLPSQILLNNFLTDTPMISVSTDTVDEDELKKPRKWNIGQLGRLSGLLGAVSSIFDIITIAILLYVLKTNVALFRTGWFLESCLSEILIVFSLRTKKPFFKARKPSKILLFVSAFIALLTIALIYSPAAMLFEFVGLPVWFLVVLVIILLSYFALTEIVKLFYYRHVLKEKA